MKIIMEIILAIICCGLCIYLTNRKKKKWIRQAEAGEELQLKRYRHTNKVFNLWLSIRSKGKKTADFFLENQIDHIAIYGYGVLGKFLERELIDSGITVDYLIDRNAKQIKTITPIFLPEQQLPDCSMIIITSQEYADIRERLVTGVSCPVFSIVDIFEVLDNDVEELTKGMRA